MAVGFVVCYFLSCYVNGHASKNMTRRYYGTSENYFNRRMRVERATAKELAGETEPDEHVDESSIDITINNPNDGLNYAHRPERNYDVEPQVIYYLLNTHIWQL